MPRPRASRRAVVLLAAVAGATGVLRLRRRYRRDLDAAHRRLEGVERRTVPTDWGRVECAEVGAGPPLLVSHGIFHGCDGGLRSVRDLVDDRHVIAPSRFGYLGSDLPVPASPADQADAFAALLDQLELATVDVIAISAGTTAAVQLVLRHPDRVDHLVISSGSFPGSATAQAPPDWARALYSDPAMWVLKVVARPAFAQLMGIPQGFPRNDAEAAVATELLESIFPIGPRAEGAVFDAFTSNPAISACPLEEIAVPTLVIHSRDDPLASYDAAVAAVDRVPDATLVTLESGGHLQLGQTERVRDELERFLSEGGRRRR